ncbi:MAG: hypothetical protein RLP02_18270, partial [Coleofasciculus sp. C2-GNP5-27]
MTKLVIFRAIGDLAKQGYSVHLIIQDIQDTDGYASVPLLDVTGSLPPNPDLASHLNHHWQQTYRPLGLPSRTLELETVTVNYEGSIQQQIQDCLTSANELRDRIRQWFDSPEFYHLNLQLREHLA